MPRPKGGSDRSELIRLAIAGIDSEVQQLQAQIEQLTDKRKQLSKGNPNISSSVLTTSIKAAKPTANAAAPAKKKRVVSAATRKKLKEAAKARWARERGEKAS